MKNITYTQFKKQLPSLIKDSGKIKYQAIVSADEKKRKKKIVVMDYDLYRAMDDYIEELECQIKLKQAMEYNRRHKKEAMNWDELKNKYSLE